jgi:hypothetical protein
MNSITELLFSKYMEGRAPPAVADYIYENTQPGSTLRKLLTASVAAVGPLHPRYGHHAKEWKDLVWVGGDFVLDVYYQVGSLIGTWRGWHHAIIGVNIFIHGSTSSRLSIGTRERLSKFFFLVARHSEFPLCPTVVVYVMLP